MEGVDFTGNASFEDMVDQFLLMDEKQFKNARIFLEDLCDAWLEAAKYVRFGEIEH